jgi:hypothetical protein
MEDKGSGVNVVTVWKLDDPIVLKMERALKEEAKLAKEAQKADIARKQLEKDEKSKIPAAEMFIAQTDIYSAFDSTGMPTHDKAGEPLTKGALKKLQKEFEKQKDANDKYNAKLNVTA